MSSARRLSVRVLALTIWSLAVWILLTWTLTLSQLAFGLAAALLVAIGCAGLGPVAPPWALLRPRRFAVTVRLVLMALVRVLRANLGLARRIWDPRLPLRSGMVVVPTGARTDAQYTATGLITSVIVDNQLVDIGRRAQQLQYHAVWVESPDPERNYDRINGPVEHYVDDLERP
jgi:multicomponent Na+:H+ antiporter subunit E